MILIIPDIHHATEKTDEIIKWSEKSYKIKQILFLGDYFDSFEDDVNRHYLTTKWLITSLEKPNRIHLLGNHDIIYFTGQQNAYCPGFSVAKYNISKSLLKTYWNQLRVFYFITDNFIASHAGITRGLVHPILPLKEFLTKEEIKFKNAAQLGLDHSWFDGGVARGGRNRVAGPLWCDWSYFQPIPGFHQVFGHTPVNNILNIKKANMSYNFMLDCACGYPGSFGIYGQNKLIIFDRNLNIVLQKTLV